MKCFICGKPTDKSTYLSHAKCKWSKEDREWEKKVEERKEKVRLTTVMIAEIVEAANRRSALRINP